MSKLKDCFEEGWWNALKPYLESKDFKDLGKKLVSESKDKIITPKFSDTFNAFKYCPYRKINTIILGTDPYPGMIDSGIYVADGLAFSSKYSRSCPKSLNYIQEAISEDVYNGDNYMIGTNWNLRSWAEQGILLLNCALTFPIGGKTGDHVDLWSPFIAHVLRTVNKEKDAVGVILMGAYAKAFKPIFTNPTYMITECEHPSRANYRGGRWEHNGVFKQLHSYHKTFNNIEINWE